MTTFHEHDGTLRVCHRHEVLLISAWGADSVRVRAAQYRIPTQLTVEVDADLTAPYPEPLLTFRRTSTGEELLAEQREHFWMPGARSYQGNRSGAYEIHQQFAAYDAEQLFGMGQRMH